MAKENTYLVETLEELKYKMMSQNLLMCNPGIQLIMNFALPGLSIRQLRKLPPATLFTVPEKVSRFVGTDTVSNSKPVAYKADIYTSIIVSVKLFS